MAQATLSKRGEEERSAPDSETEPQQAPETLTVSWVSEEQLLSRISEEREKRGSAERVLQENLKEQERFRGLLGGLRSTFFDADGSARTRLEQEYEQLKAQYDRTDETYLRAVGEYMESTVLSEVDARSKLYEAEVEALSNQHKSEGGQELNPVYRAWKALDKINSEWSAQKILGEKLKLSLPENLDPRLAGVLRFAGKVMTPRTALALGLVGFGFGAYGVAAKGIETGLGAVAGLATMRGIGVSVLSRDVVKWAREELPLVKLQPKYDKEKPLLQRIQLFEKLTPESIAAFSPEEVQQRLVDASSAITLYGNKELLRDPRYQELLKAYSAQTIEGQRQFEEAEGEKSETTEATERRAEQYLKYLDADINELGSQIQKVQKEKKITGKVTIVLLTTAAVVLPGIAHLRRLEEIHPGEAMQLLKEVGKTIQEAFGSLAKFLDPMPPAWADTGEAPATDSAAPAAPLAASPPAAGAGGGGWTAEEWEKNAFGKGFSVSGPEGKFVVTAKIGGGGLLEKTTHQDQVLRVFLSRFYGDWLAEKYGGKVPKHALNAIENVIQNLKDPAIVEKIVGEKVNIVSYDPADPTGRTLQIAFTGKEGEPLDKLMDHALKVATPNAGGTHTAHDLWQARLGHPVEDFKTGKPPVAAPSGVGEQKTGVPPEVGSMVDAKASGGAKVVPTGAGAAARPPEEELRRKFEALDDGETRGTDAIVKRVLAGPRGPIPFVEGVSGEHIATKEWLSSDRADHFNAHFGKYHYDAAQMQDLSKSFTDFLDKLKTQGIVVDESKKDATINLYRVLPKGVSTTDGMLALLSKVSMGDMDYLAKLRPDGALQAHDYGTLYQVQKELVKHGALRVEGGRAVLSYNPSQISELFDKAYHARHVTVDRVAGKIPPDEWKRMLSWEERPAVRPAVSEPASGSAAVPSLEAASGSSTVTPPGSGSVAPVIEAVPRSAAASPSVPASASNEALQASAFIPVVQPPEAATVSAPAVEPTPTPPSIKEMSLPALQNALETTHHLPHRFIADILPNHTVGRFNTAVDAMIKAGEAHDKHAYDTFYQRGTFSDQGLVRAFEGSLKESKFMLPWDEVKPTDYGSLIRLFDMVNDKKITPTAAEQKMNLLDFLQKKGSAIL